jgi:transglutaminase-like putative cysteine protease
VSVSQSTHGVRGAAPRVMDVPAHYIRPHAARDIRGLAWVGEDLLVLDARSGRICLVDPTTDVTRVVNDGWCDHAEGATGLAVDGSGAWFTTRAGVHRAQWAPGGQPAHLEPPQLALPAEGGAPTAVALWGDLVYLVSAGHLVVLEAEPGSLRELARRADLPGVGATGITATEDALWLSDDVEQTVYCLDRRTLETRMQVVTPLEGPTAIAARRLAGSTEDEVHVAYHEREPFLKDDPWSDPSWVVRYRDRALIHPLHVLHDPASRMAWSTGHRIRMSYYVEVEPDDDIEALAAGGCLTDVRWRMALPINTARQRVVSVEPIGLPFRLDSEADLDGVGQPVAEFRIDRVEAGTRLVLGWQAIVEVVGIKHQLTAVDMAAAPALDPRRAAAYLVDDEDLDLDTPEVGAATAAAIGDERNPLLQARRIRTHVYDLLEYEMGYGDTPVDVMARGTGSCGEYVSTIMALMRRAGLACRVAGRYKCPYQPWSSGPLYPDFNHVWVDLYLPGHGWVPVESNPDDVVDGGPYPDRFFMGLPWRHVEVGKDISFEKVTYATGDRRRRIGARRLSRNHIRFDVLAEIAPVAAPAR